jgi:hypothetical protein
LQNENNINLPYREIAERTQVGLGNINYIINGLKEMGFLIRLNKDEVKLINKKELLDKWITAYEEKLKPNLKIGTFRLMNNNTIDNWKLLPLQHNKTCWGGEPAGDILTNYLRPAELTLYTIETRNELIKNYQLMPDETGNVNVYKKFWRQDLEIDNEYIAPPILVYADLINTDDKRCRETAERIYEQYIQPNI